MSLTCTARVADRDLDVSVIVEAGETLALLGPNGAGKSTLLSVVAGLLRPDSGHVELAGRRLTDDRTWVAPHRRRVALLAQQPLLFPHLSVLDNVAFGPRAQGVGRREAARVAQTWLERLDLSGFADRRPAELSGGQAQRVAVARALATDPDVLLLDEPLAALDVSVAPDVRETLRRVLADRTAVVVTHDVVDAALLADRIAVLDQGRVVESGPAAQVLARPRSSFAARIAGLNLVRGTWDGSHVVTAAGHDARWRGGRPGAGCSVTRWWRSSGPARSRSTARPPRAAHATCSPRRSATCTPPATGSASGPATSAPTSPRPRSPTSVSPPAQQCTWWSRRPRCRSTATDPGALARPLETVTNCGVATQIRQDSAS